MRSASRSTSARSWLVSRIAAPVSRRPATRLRVVARASGSMPAVGSSRIDDLGATDDRHRQREPASLAARQAAIRRSRDRGAAPSARAGRRGPAGRRGRPRTGGGSRPVVPACRRRRPGASARPVPATPGRRAGGRCRAPGPCPRPRRGSPRRSRPSWSSRRRSVRARRRSRRGRRQRDAVDDGARPVALDEALDDDRGSGPDRRGPPGRRGRADHGAMAAYWRSKSASVSPPAWMDRTTPVAIDEVRLWPGGDAIGRLEGFVRVDDRRPVGRELVDERARELGRIVGQDADHGEPVRRVLGELRLEQRELVATRDARRAPEVDDDRPAGVRGEIEGRAVEGRPDDRGRRLPGRDPRAVVADADEQVHADGRGDGDGKGDDDRATRRGWTSGSAYWRVAVPVMFGWIVHRNS